MDGCWKHGRKEGTRKEGGRAEGWIMWRDSVREGRERERKREKELDTIGKQ